MKHCKVLSEQALVRRDYCRTKTSKAGRAGLRGQATLRGFSLIELMITVAIVALLAAIALPSYTNSVRKAKRMDAKIALLDMASRQERFFSTNNTYTSSAANLGYTTLPASVPSSGTTTYEISVSSATAGAYSLLATPKGDQLKDSCGSYTITQVGKQTNNAVSGAFLPLTDALSADCWR